MTGIKYALLVGFSLSVIQWFIWLLATNALSSAQASLSFILFIGLINAFIFWPVFKKNEKNNCEECGFLKEAYLREVKEDEDI